MKYRSKSFLKISFALAALATIINMVLFIYTKSFAGMNKSMTDEIDHPRRLLDMHDFEYLTTEPSCFIKSNQNEKEEPYFVVLLHSAPLNAANRQTLRETWLHKEPRMLTFFVMGQTHSKSAQKRINRENKQFGDIIQGNFVDSYHNLTYKQTMAMKWFNTHCTGVKFLIKMDDDVFMNVPAVFEYLKKNENSNQSIMGLLVKPESPQRQGKWKISREQWIDNMYPECVLGGAIIYSAQYVRDAYEKALTTRFYWVDDVFYTAIIRMQLLIKITDLTDQMSFANEWELSSTDSTDVDSKSFLFVWEVKSRHLYKQLWEKINKI